MQRSYEMRSEFGGNIESCMRGSEIFYTTCSHGKGNIDTLYLSSDQNFAKKYFQVA